jgi:predicted DNA binding CopG/RHH family protein
MPKTPKLGSIMDDEEKALIALIESDAYRVGQNFLNPERLDALRQSARATMNEERTKISLRLPKSDLDRLKAKALREGMPYQTLINSILHKAVST